ncbi:MAG: hypothetical protein V1823_04385, partial [Chloroflexota bacterium]
FNRYRFKTGQQLYNEGKALKEIEAVRQERARRAKIAYYQTTGETVENFPPSKGETKTRDIIAQSIGQGTGTYRDNKSSPVGLAGEPSQKVGVKLALNCLGWVGTKQYFRYKTVDNEKAFYARKPVSIEF